MNIWAEQFEQLREASNCCSKCGSYKHTTKECTVKEDITLTRGDYGSRNVVGSAWHTAAKRGFKGYKAGGGLTPQFKLADEFQLEGNQRDPEGQEKDRKRSKQSDPSKDNFTGISGSIATIMKQNAAMKKAAAAKKVKKEEYDNTKSPDYAKKKKALAKKHGGADKVKGHPQYESVQSAVDALDSYMESNKKLHGSVIEKKN